MAREQESSGIIEGICGAIPKKCSLAKNGTLQRVPRSEPKCAECQREITEAKRTRNPPLPWPAILGAVAGVILLGAGGFFAYPTIIGFFDSIRAGTCDEKSVDAARSGAPEAALTIAQTCREKGRLDETIRILSGLKEKGSGAASLHLGEMYDPLDPAQKQPKHLTPSIITAVEFYRQACALKVPEAGAKLAALKEPAAQEAAQTKNPLMIGLVDKWPVCGP